MLQKNYRVWAYKPVIFNRLEFFFSLSSLSRYAQPKHSPLRRPRAQRRLHREFVLQIPYVYKSRRGSHTTTTIGASGNRSPSGCAAVAIARKQTAADDACFDSYAWIYGPCNKRGNWINLPVYRCRCRLFVTFTQCVPINTRVRAKGRRPDVGENRFRRVRLLFNSAAIRYDTPAHLTDTIDRTIFVVKNNEHVTAQPAADLRRDDWWIVLPLEISVLLINNIRSGNGRFISTIAIG